MYTTLKIHELQHFPVSITTEAKTIYFPRHNLWPVNYLAMNNLETRNILIYFNELKK